MSSLGPLLLSLVLFVGGEWWSGADVAWWFAIPFLALPHVCLALANFWGRRGAFRRATFLAGLIRFAGVIGFGFLLFGTNWRATVEAWMGMSSGLEPWPTWASPVAYAPAILFQFASIAAETHGIDPSPEGHSRVRRHWIQSYLTLLSPLAVLGLAAIVTGSIPALAVRIEEVRLVATLFALVIALVTTQFVPFAFVTLWETSSLPPALDERFGRLLERGQVQVAGRHVWGTARTLSNALVVGLSAWSRRVFVTDGLLQRLSVEELEAVLAHELGHVRKGHTTTFAWIVASSYAILAALEEELVDRELAWQIGVPAVLLGVLFLAIARLSREFEFEADLEAQALIGHASGLVSALERLSGPKSFRRGGLRHPSPERRVKFLEAVDADPSRARAHTKKLDRLRRAAQIIGLLSVGLLLVTQMRRWSRDQFYADLRLGHVDRALARPLEEPQALRLKNALSALPEGARTREAILTALESTGHDPWSEWLEAADPRKP